MKRLRNVALCSVAALAMSVVAAGSASAALPEFTGPFPKPFKSKGGAVLVETSGIKLTCVASTDVGEVTGAKTGKVMIRLTGCAGQGFPCTSPGAAPGEMVTSELATSLGFINKAKLEVGVDLAAVPPTPFEEFECDGIKFAVEGSLIGKLTPVNKKVKPAGHFVLKFAQAKGIQKPRKLEGGPVDVLVGHIVGGELSAEAGLATKDEISFTETVEVKA